MKTEEQKNCEVCGEMKPLDDFSKSYPNRCKKCVAEQTRIKRAQARQTSSDKQYFEMNAEQTAVILKAASMTKALFSHREFEVLAETRNSMRDFIENEQLKRLGFTK